ncbi:40S ribosomal protein S2-like [Peromyscus leucopus]|uniref:40S ribosomal protein S2-like n=1 Tax=Peromyscus leucopus TaxID=10041 RepID=UPI001885626E|nr:40S ribosomal protein S2-like [Peromyscus leucopus]
MPKPRRVRAGTVFSRARNTGCSPASKHCPYGRRRLLRLSPTGRSPSERRNTAGGKHQMAAASAAGGPGGPRGPGLGGCGGLSGARGGKAEDKEWIPITKLGRLVKDMKIKSLEEIYLFSLPIKESEIIHFFLGASLKDEVLKIMPVQNQTWAGQWTRFKPRPPLMPSPRATAT